MPEQVLIAGGGIAGLTLGLVLHARGIPFQIYEAVQELAPLGVGINLQPTAVRELTDLGLAGMLDEIGVPTQDYGFYTRTGQEIWTEPRGVAAGYHWPQYSVHRGRLQMALYDALRGRAGDSAIQTGQRAAGFEPLSDGVSLILETDTGPQRVGGTVLVAADGIHSALRAQIYPDEGAPIWGGAVLWRGTTRTRPFLSGASMVLAGNDSQRMVCYPITPVDPATGLAEINWIAERKFDPAAGWNKEDWNRQARLDDVLPGFENWQFDWLDMPGLIRGAERIYEYPMVDRDPLERWTEGPVTLIGDAAHPTYPVGSNGASQAIVDAATLGAALVAKGITPAALETYEAQIRPVANRAVLANRGQGPDAIMQMAEDRCGGDFSRLDELFPMEERRAHAEGYKQLIGLSVDAVNTSG